MRFDGRRGCLLQARATVAFEGGGAVALEVLQVVQSLEELRLRLLCLLQQLLHCRGAKLVGARVHLEVLRPFCTISQAGLHPGRSVGNSKTDLFRSVLGEEKIKSKLPA